MRAWESVHEHETGDDVEGLQGAETISKASILKIFEILFGENDQDDDEKIN